MMHLVHLELAPLSALAVLPPDLRSVLCRYAAPHLLEHISVHTSAKPYPVIGLYLQTSSPQKAEVAARNIWAAAKQEPTLAGWCLRRAQVPPIPPSMQALGDPDETED
ncbi:hypothetical protein ACH4VR_13250 [Streptomyces sp. NPDC020883]|uniref:hypothetical protein n=1 Tax=Streptomyces sp. NPDC020883 TaxID=3365099 RepID=UPI003797F3AF